MTNSSSQAIDDSTDFVEREVSVTSAKDEDSLALVTFTVWMSECIKRGIKIVGNIPGSFLLTPKGKNKDRHMTCTGQIGDGPRVGVRVRPTKDD